MQTQKKNSSRRGSMRDIAVKKPKEEDSFTVHPIQSHPMERDDDMPRVEPLDDSDTYDEDMERHDQVESAIEEALHPSQSYEQTQQIPSEPKDLVKVRFSKFVQLVNSHSFTDVLKNNENEDVVLSSNLLTELAGAHDGREERKIPLVFLVGLAIGVVLTYIFITK